MSTRISLKSLEPEIRGRIKNFATLTQHRAGASAFPVSSAASAELLARRQKMGFLPPLIIFPAMAIFIAVMKSPLINHAFLPYFAMMMPVAIGSAIFAAFFFQSNWSTPDHLVAMGEALGFSDVEMQYLTTFGALHSGKIGKQLETELNSQLSQLITEYEKLEGKKKSLADYCVGGSTSQKAVDLQRIESKLASTVDESARALYQESLKMAQSRSVNKLAAAALIDRVDAQQELVRQTMFALSDAVASLNGSPVQTDDSVDLRSRLLDIRSQTEAIDEAVREIGLLV